MSFKNQMGYVGQLTKSKIWKAINNRPSDGNLSDSDDLLEAGESVKAGENFDKGAGGEEDLGTTGELLLINRGSGPQVE